MYTVHSLIEKSFFVLQGDQLKKITDQAAALQRILTYRTTMRTSPKKNLTKVGSSSEVRQAQLRLLVIMQMTLSTKIGVIPLIRKQGKLFLLNIMIDTRNLVYVNRWKAWEALGHIDLRLKRA